MIDALRVAPDSSPGIATRDELGLGDEDSASVCECARSRRRPSGAPPARAHREFERMLVDEGTTLVRVLLNVSADQQRARLQERIDDPAKRSKFRRDDLEVRRRFDEYVSAWEDVLAETSTEWAPWHVVPADRDWVRSTAVAVLLVDALEWLDPKLPDAEPAPKGW